MIAPNIEEELIRALQGIQEVAPNVDGLLDEVHGLWDPRLGSLERLPGKLLNTTSVSSSVWNIHQLRFRERGAIITHGGVDFVNTVDAPSLPGINFPSVDFDVVGPQVFEPDFPEDEWSDEVDDPIDPEDPATPDVVWPGDPTDGTDAEPAYIILDPDTHSLPNISGDTVFYSELTKDWSNRVKWGGLCYIHVAWDTSKTWLTVRDHGVTQVGSFAIPSGSLRAYGFWQDRGFYSLWIGFHVDVSLLPEGVAQSATVTFRAMSSRGQLLLNPGGSIVSESVVISVLRVIETQIGFLTGSPLEISYAENGGVSHAFTIQRATGTSPLYWRVSHTQNGSWPSGATTVIKSEGVAINESTVYGPITGTKALTFNVTGLEGDAAVHGATILAEGFLDAAGTQPTNDVELEVEVDFTPGASGDAVYAVPPLAATYVISWSSGVGSWNVAPKTLSWDGVRWEVAWGPGFGDHAIQLYWDFYGNGQWAAIFQEVIAASWVTVDVWTKTTGLTPYGSYAGGSGYPSITNVRVY